MNRGFALFDTVIGVCGIAWSERGVTCVQLPDGDRGRTVERLLRVVPGTPEGVPPAAVRGAVAGVVRQLRGEPGGLASVELDMSGVPAFGRRVYETVRAVPAGESVTYAAVAERMGRPEAARAVGRALARNPFALVVPCHRVVPAGGRTGGAGGAWAGGGVTRRPGLRALESAARTAAAGGAAAGGPAAGGPGQGAGYGYGFDPGTAVAYLRASDPGLAAVMDRTGPFAMPLNAAASVFAALAEAIVHQQLSTKAAATIHGRLRGLFPGAGGLSAEHVLGADDELLRSAGLSRPKVASLRDLAHRVDTGMLPEVEAIREMEDEAVVACLSSVRGIGRWTAQMFLMFRLGRPDVLPVDDLGLRHGFSIAFGGTAPAGVEEIEKRGALWRPFRSVACWYLWEALEEARRGPSS
ncbi:methylated-DNA--[protein]-cysteine S-methyltransferase [Streptomyces sp. NPDC090108]|uniref:methylated-DNA--[protein]-cysteine S-methyltransferase n=1 Tax=Streptomyces sp. NPDC090108 TaxID=3365947 RepID=UPI00380199F5